MSDRAVAEQKRKKQGQMSRYDRRGPRTSSNIFSAFTQQEIQEFKEAFNMIDQNHDGFIDHDDLMEMMTSLGAANVNDDEVAKMLSDAAGPVNFTMFLTMFSERLQSTDPGKVLLNAFRMFDEQDTGYIPVNYLRHLLTSFCNRWTQEMVDQLYSSPQLIDNERGFNYVEFVRRIKGYVAALDEDEVAAAQQQLEQQKKLIEQADTTPAAYKPRRLSFKPPDEVIPSLTTTTTTTTITTSQQQLLKPAATEPAVASTPLTTTSNIKSIAKVTATESSSSTSTTSNLSKTTSIKGATSLPPQQPQLNIKQAPSSSSSSSSSGSTTIKTSPAIVSSAGVDDQQHINLTASKSNKSSSSLEQPVVIAATVTTIPVATFVPSSSSPSGLAATIADVPTVETAPSQKTIAQLRENFFLQQQQDTLLPSSPPPPTVNVQPLTAPKLFNSSNQQQQHERVKRVASNDNKISSSIPVPIVPTTTTTPSKRLLAQDVITNKPPSYVDDTSLPPIRIEAKFENSKKEQTTSIMDVSPALLAPEDLVPPALPSARNFWRQQQQSQQVPDEPPPPSPSSSGVRTNPWRQQQKPQRNSPQFSETVKALESSPPFASPTVEQPKRRLFGSADKLLDQESPPLQPLQRAVSGQQQQHAILLLQENPLSRQLPAFGYHTVTTTTTTTMVEDQMTSSSTSTTTEPEQSPRPLSVSERKLSFAKITLATPSSNNNGNNKIGSKNKNLMTASSGSIRASLTERMPPMAVTKIRAIDSSRASNDAAAASRIMSSSMVSVSSNSSSSAASKRGSVSSNLQTNK